jgi:SagB-type dehydrogenase family enzyme
MASALVISLRRDVSVGVTDGTQTVLAFPWGSLPLGPLSPGQCRAMRVLETDGATADELADVVLAADGVAALATWYYRLQRLNAAGLLRYALVGADGPLATIAPTVGGLRLGRRQVAPDDCFQLSRFAFCRRDGEDLILESPLIPARVVLASPIGVAAIAALARPRSYPELCAATPSALPDEIRALLGLLAESSAIAEIAPDGTLEEDRNPALAQWEFPDLLFHTRSRLGRRDAASGGTFRFVGQIPPLPAVKPSMSEDVLPLYRPDLDRLAREDPPFTAVLERRVSLRDHGDRAITAEQLGEFLYRVGRVRGMVGPDPAEAWLYEVTSRPYPSGGAAYDLELYVAVRACGGVAPGLYHYEPVAHRLARLAARDEQIEALLRDARAAAGTKQDPQVLILLASRFARLSWKYSGVAYALSLKNAGVLFQTMYLVATAMGLAGCALGAGNPDLFAHAAGTDYYAESTVGEFMLGSPAESA